MEGYLTPELKQFYMSDFNENVLKCEDEFWDLDDGVKDTLRAVNSNQNIQTLYSKREPFNGSTLNPKSYIVFAYSQPLELKIFREEIPFFMACFNMDKDRTFMYFFEHPKIEEDDKIEREIKLACMNDPSYWNINNIRLELQSHKKEVHERFWNEIKTRFSNLN